MRTEAGRTIETALIENALKLIQRNRIQGVSILSHALRTNGSHLLIPYSAQYVSIPAKQACNQPTKELDDNICAALERDFAL